MVLNVLVGTGTSGVPVPTSIPVPPCHPFHALRVYLLYLTTISFINLHNLQVP